MSSFTQILTQQGKSVENILIEKAAVMMKLDLVKQWFKRGTICVNKERAMTSQLMK